MLKYEKVIFFNADEINICTRIYIYEFVTYNTVFYKRKMKL